MTLATVHRRGFQAAALLMSPWVVVVALPTLGVVTGFWWPLIALAFSLFIGALGAVDAVRVYLTRGWPKVEADVVDQEERGTYTFDSHVIDYSQRLVYVYRNRWFESPLKWRRYPPTQVVLRVNPDEPTEVFCVEQLGGSWIVSLLCALVFPPFVLLGLMLDWGRLTGLLVLYLCLGGAAWLASRLRPDDRADFSSAQLRPNIRLHSTPPRRSRAASRRG